MARFYSILLNVKVEKNDSGRNTYSFSAWKNAKITKNSQIFDWTKPIVKNQDGNLLDLGDKLFSAVQEMAKTKQ